MKKIRIAKPWITDIEISYVEDAMKNGWGGKCYDYIIRLEKLFSEYLGSKYVVATSSCTGATHMALAAMGIGKGDEVILPETTWASCAAAIMYTGAKPVFVDIKNDTWCIDPKKIEKAITEKTKAIMPVHIYGNVAEMKEIIQIASNNDIRIIEDSAQGLGSEYEDQKVGSIGDCGVFSLHGTKLATAGEGGIFVTNQYELYNKFLILHSQGRVPNEKKLFFPHYVGFKYRISNIQAALACAQIERIEELILKKREIFSWYKDCFNDDDLFSMNYEQTYVKNCYWMPILRFSEKIDINIDDLANHLSEYNIETRPFFIHYHLYQCIKL